MASPSISGWKPWPQSIHLISSSSSSRSWPGKHLPGLLELLKAKWRPEQIRDLLRSRHCDAKKVALLALALVGPTCCTEELSHQLQRFLIRSSTTSLNAPLGHLAPQWQNARSQTSSSATAAKLKALGTRNFPRAIEIFSQAIRVDPDFAEAYNQRASPLLSLRGFR